MSSASEEEMDYEQAVERLVAMFPHIRRDFVVRELTAAGSVALLQTTTSTIVSIVSSEFEMEVKKMK